jgi:WD domain, G-beta repeat
MRDLPLLPALLGILACIFALSARGGEERPLPVLCPALEHEASTGPAAPLGGPFRTDLVVLGTGRHERDGPLGVEIEEVFFGVAPGPRILIPDSRGNIPEGRRIFRLEERSPGSAEYSSVYSACPRTLPATPANIAGLRALGRARLELIVLSAEAMFVGRETGFATTEDLSEYHNEEFVRTVEISKVLAGPAALEGRSVRVRVPGISRSSRKAKLAEGEWLFVIGGYDGRLPFTFERDSEPPLLERELLVVRRQLPAGLAGQVPEILASRSSLPVTEWASEGPLREVRRIVYPGSVAEAISILDSDCRGAPELALASLVRRPEEARAPVLKALRESLFDLDPEASVRHRTLSRLVRALGRMERAEPRGDLDRLIVNWLDFLESDPPEPPPSTTDSNRSLLWLLQAMDPVRARRLYGSRLFALREAASAGWKAELDKVLDLLMVRDALQLPAALAHGREVKARHSWEGAVRTLAHSNHQVAFSHRGEYLAFDAGDFIQIHRTEDWAPLVRIPYQPSVDRLEFSPDDRHLLVSGYGDFTRFSVPAGEKVDAGDGARTADALVSADGRTVAVLNEAVVPPFASQAGSVSIYRIGDGRRERVATLALPSATMAEVGALSPDGTLLASAGDGNVVRIYVVSDLALHGWVRFPLPRASDLSIRSMAFDPRGRMLAVAFGEAVPGLVDLETMERVHPYPGHSDEVEEAVIAADGRTLFTRGRDSRVCLWDLGTLEMVGRWELPHGGEPASRSGLRHERILALRKGSDGDEGAEGRPAKLFDARTGKLIRKLTLPPGTAMNKVRWIFADRLLLFSHQGEWVRRFDLGGGGSGSTHFVPEKDLDSGDIGEGGRYLYVPGSRYKRYREPSVRQIDLDSGEEVKRSLPGVVRFTCREFGLVPGGRHLFFAAPGVQIYERDTLAVVSRQPLPGISIGDLSFSGDGTRYAVAATLARHPAEVRELCPEGTVTLIRVHDTTTGEPLYAFPSRSHRPKLAFDHDGRRLVMVEDDGGMVCWPVLD